MRTVLDRRDYRNSEGNCFEIGRIVVMAAPRNGPCALGVSLIALAPYGVIKISPGLHSRKPGMLPSVGGWRVVRVVAGIIAVLIWTNLYLLARGRAPILH
jgi:hypothetical protein